MRKSISSWSMRFPNQRIVVLFILFYFFSLSSIKSQYTKLHDFDDTTGIGPEGGLISDGTFLYGMTYGGGGPTASSYGTVFKIKPDGSAFDTLHCFNPPVSLQPSMGTTPHGSLVFDGTFLYGMTEHGGPVSSDAGVVFRVKPDGTAFDTLMIFTLTNGATPKGSLFYDGSFLYGTTPNGSINDKGTIFRLKPDGTGDTVLLHFGNTPDGWGLPGDLISDGTFLYGMAGGGANSKGLIFKINPDGTGYANIFDFDSIKGTGPVGSLIYDGTFLYGMTQIGGTNNKGVIFRIKPDGSGDTVLHNFSAADGWSPRGSLISDGIYLYGMTFQGGINNLGVIFKIKTDGTGYFKMLDFDGANGAYPYGSLFSDGTFLYGMTSSGGAYYGGVLFKIDITTGITEFNKQNLVKIFPNPNNGRLRIAGETNRVHAFKISDLRGKLILHENFQNSEIDLTQFEDGLYLINFFSQEGALLETQKIIKAQ